MRIGIFGNTNNYPLRLAFGLRRLGHDAVLFVNRKERLHRPESRHPELERGYPGWICDCSDIAEEDFIAATPPIAPVIDALGCADVLLLNDLGPSLLEYCPRPSVAMLTGSDLTYYADPAMPALRYRGCDPHHAQTAGARLWLRQLEAFVDRQRAGIRGACIVGAPLPGLVPEMDALLDDIGTPIERREFFYFASVDNAPHTRTASTGRLRIVNGARLNWKKPLPSGFISMDHKGTDVLLEGFARFLAGGGDGELVLIRKGLHVTETEQLVTSLGIANRVVWKHEMPLYDFYAEMTAADVVCDQLGDSFPGMVAVDAMALGLPVIANFRPEIMAARFDEPIAACQARTADEVATHLTALAASREARIAAGGAARRFAQMHLSPIAQARRCLARLGLDARIRESLRTDHESRNPAAGEPAAG